MNRTPLLVIFSLFVACRKDPPARPPPSPPPPRTATPDPGPGAPPAASVAPAAPASAFRESARFLPQGAAAPGWTQSGDVHLFSGQELFQAIDGAGAKYVEYGFRQMARADYRKVGTQLAVTAEVYDMGSVLGAYGMYTSQLSDSRDPASMRARAVTHGGGGFLGTSQLVFWRGQHFVLLNLADDSGEQDENALATTAREVLPALATTMAASIPGETTAPAPPAGMPADALVWSGMTYLASGVLGIDQSGAGWVGHYEAPGGARYRIAYLTRPNADEARALLQRARGTGAAALAGVGDEAFGNATLAAARKGGTVIIVAGPSPENLTALPREARVERLRAVVAALP